MIQISLKCLADYMTADAARQRKILYESKYPQSDEAKSKVLYYREARDAVCAYHRMKHPRGWLLTQAGILDAQASSSSGQTQTRLKNNARAVRAYDKHFGVRDFQGLTQVKWTLNAADVKISVCPDLHVTEKGKEKIIKLGFSVDKPDETSSKVISQCMFEASCQAGLGLSSSGVLFLDVARGEEYRGARVGARMKKNIEAACTNIAAIWAGI